MSHLGHQAFIESQYEAQQEAEAAERRITLTIISIGLFIFFTGLILLSIFY